MKTAFILLAVVAVAFSAAVPKDDKKPDPKPTDKPTDKPTERPADKPTDKPEEKPDEKREGRLQWPLPDDRSEGDLMLHGSFLFDRVEELRKAKLENDVDKMILAVGRDFLRRAEKYLEATPDFKVVPVLCHDSREMSNKTRRWEIRLQPEHQPIEEKKEEAKKEEAKKEDKPAEQAKPQSDATSSKTKRDAPKEERLNVTEVVNATEAPKPIEPIRKDDDTFDARRVDYYRRLGDNFARLLLKHYRKEKLSDEEREYIENWSDDEAIHYGVMGIYCHEGENVKDLIKKIKEYIEDK